jgi:hypothetical protein
MISGITGCIQIVQTLGQAKIVKVDLDEAIKQKRIPMSKKPSLSPPKGNARNMNLNHTQEKPIHRR